jgi:hypothetical protein
MRAERGYRVPIAALRRLAACDIHLDLAEDADEKSFDEALLQDLAAGITVAIAREGLMNRADALQHLSERIAGALGIRLADWTGLQRQGFAQFAPLLAQIDDLATWPKAERDALGEIIRARWAPQERDFIAGMRGHDRLRLALARAAQRRIAQP